MPCLGQGSSQQCWTVDTGKCLCNRHVILASSCHVCFMYLQMHSSTSLLLRIFIHPAHVFRGDQAEQPMLYSCWPCCNYEQSLMSPSILCRSPACSSLQQEHSCEAPCQFTGSAEATLQWLCLSSSTNVCLVSPSSKNPSYKLKLNKQRYAGGLDKEVLFGYADQVVDFTSC